MRPPILAGIETEYGLFVEGHSAEDQIDDAVAFVRGYPGSCHVGWNYRYESPRCDLRGFSLGRLASDPRDAKFDQGRKPKTDLGEIRSDRILPNGARFYNDHGHPEYATPECFSLMGLARHDAAGELVLRRCARALTEQTGLSVKVYKNNTDFHGASYGTHESYLVQRSLPYEALFDAVAPMLVARTILCGAGKVGSEHGKPCEYQLSQRADFLTEEANAETLYHRPVFNTRDEPHAEENEWIRLHVISSDANRIPESTARKVGLVKLAVALAGEKVAPNWKIPDLPGAFSAVSRDCSLEYPVALAGRNWTTAGEILESYFSAAEAALDLDADLRWTIDSSRELLRLLREDFAEFSKRVDWAAKKRMIESYIEEERTSWSDPVLQSFDLEYHNIDPSESLYHALLDLGLVKSESGHEDLAPLLDAHTEPTRALARGLAVSRFDEYLVAGCWRSLVFESEAGSMEIELDPSAEYPSELTELADVESFVRCLRGMQ